MGRDRFVKTEWGDKKAPPLTKDFGYDDHGWKLATVDEKAVYDRLKAEGYTVHKNGWPDFMASRGDEVRLIEVKNAVDVRRESQLRVHAGLAKLGARVEEVVIENPNRFHTTNKRIWHKPRGLATEIRDRQR